MVFKGGEDKVNDAIYVYEQFLIGKTKSLKKCFLPAREENKKANEERMKSILAYIVKTYFYEYSFPELEKKLTISALKDFGVGQSSNLERIRQFKLLGYHSSYLIHLAYPDDYPYNEEGALKKALLKNFKQGYSHIKEEVFTLEDGESKLLKLHKFSLESIKIFSDVKNAYEFYSRKKAITFLKRLGIYKAMKLYYETPLIFLHKTLQSVGKENENIYNYYKEK